MTEVSPHLRLYRAMTPHERRQTGLIVGALVRGELLDVPSKIAIKAQAKHEDFMEVVS